MRRGVLQYLPIGAVIGLVLFFELVLVFGAWVVAPEVAATAAAPMPPPAQISNTAALGGLLYTRYVYAFQAAGMVLLVAMIGAIVLTHRSRDGVRKQRTSVQVARRREDSVEVVKVRSGEGVS
jgi:NADH-quinone oxidoreductase subunit J